MKKTLIIFALFLTFNAKAQLESRWKIELVKIQRHGDASKITGQLAVGFFDRASTNPNIPLKAEFGAIINSLWYKYKYQEDDILKSITYISANENQDLYANIYYKIKSENLDWPDIFYRDYSIKTMPAPVGASNYNPEKIVANYNGLVYKLKDWATESGKEKTINIKNDTNPFNSVEFTIKFTLVKGEKPINSNDNLTIAENAIKEKNLSTDCHFIGNAQVIRSKSKWSGKVAWTKTYDNGWIGYFPENGKILYVKSPLSNYKKELLNQDKSIGFPVSSYASTKEGAIQEFEGGKLLYNPITNTHLVKGLVRVKWEKIGAEKTTGFPKTDEISTINNAGVVQYFEDGSLYFKFGKQEAYYLKGEMYKKYVALGNEKSVLGYPRTDFEEDKPKNGGNQWFENGAIYFTPATGAHYVPNGVLYDQYGFNNFQYGKLGYPTSDPITLDGVLSQEFEGGLISGKNVILNTAPEYTKFKKLIGSSLKKVNFN